VDHAHVPATFFGRRLGILAVQHAVREVNQLRRKLIAAPAFLLLHDIADCQRVAQCLGIFIRGLRVDVALTADNAQIGDATGGEARREGRQAVAVEAHDSRRHLVNFRHIRPRAIY